MSVRRRWTRRARSLVAVRGLVGRLLPRPARGHFIPYHLRPHAPLGPAAARPLAACGYCVLDTETTGLDPGRDDVVAVGAVRVRHGRVRHDEWFEALARPPRPIPARATRFHGIADGMVAGAPPIEALLPAFQAFCGEDVLVAHNAAFDLAMLGRTAEALGRPFTAPVLCTLDLSAALFGRHHDHSLEALAGRFNIAVRGRHTALGDAVTTAAILVRLIEEARSRGVETLGQAIRLARRAEPPRHPPRLW
jgi:DNA polymerase-3 subunit epsilon